MRSRDDVIRVARAREPNVQLRDITTDVGISESGPNRRLEAATSTTARKTPIHANSSRLICRITILLVG